MLHDFVLPFLVGSLLTLSLVCVIIYILSRGDDSYREDFHE